MPRTDWFALAIGKNPSGQVCYAAMDDQGTVGALFHQVDESGAVEGVRFMESGETADLAASGWWTALVGIKEAFRADARDKSARVN